MVQATAHDRRQSILVEVREERLSQLGAHDDSLMQPELWVARTVKHLGRSVSNDPVAFRRSMVVVAALAVAAIEWMDDRFGRV